ncbi:stress response protein nst1-like isoform X3 [Varroa jacobsoni]|uniref:stress response protein nst1-like isoform X3 n=1 Tax=Varroa jacobsoni TaxID=62625 RepID=UPI000BF971EB|nr:stress response protein nst1-like isoform X3 [Varroa jacobsoni]
MRFLFFDCEKVFGMSNRTIRRKIAQMNESEEERKMRLEADARRKRLRRASETLAERQQRLATAAERQRARRANETPEERIRRLAMDADRQRERRANESPMDRQRRLAMDAERQRERRAKESAVERQHRLAMDAERQRERRANESVAERQKRLASDSERHMERRANESVEQRQQSQLEHDQQQPQQQHQRVLEAPERTEQLIEVKYKVVAMQDESGCELIKTTPDICNMATTGVAGTQNCGETTVKAEYGPELQYLYEDYSKLSGLNRRSAPLAWHQYHTIHVRALQVPILSTTSMTPESNTHVVTVASAPAVPSIEQTACTELVAKNLPTHIVTQE